MKRAALWFGLALGVLLVAVVVGVAVLLQSGPGQRFVLRTAVNVVEGQIDGSLEVGGIRSAGLLRGLTLDRVALRDAEGRPFLEADSLRIGYSVRGLLARNAVLDPVEIWRPRLTVETLPGDSLSNVVRIFAGGEAAPEAEAEAESGTLRLELRRATLHDGTVTLQLPDSEPTVLRDLNARIRSATLVTPDAPGERVVVDALSMEVELGGVGEAPFRIEAFEGEIRRVGTRLEVDADPLRLPNTRLEGTGVVDWADGLALALDLAADPFQARDLAWLDNRIPELGGSFLLEAEGPLATSEWRLDAVDLATEPGPGGASDRVRGRIAVQLGDPLRILESSVDADMRLSILDPWLEEPLPVQGRVAAAGSVTGTLARLQVDATVAYQDPARGIPASDARITGGVNLESAQLSALNVRVDPLRLATLRGFLPPEALGDLALVGEGSLDLTATGSLATGIEVEGRLLHSTAALDLSRVEVAGTIREADGTLVLAMDAGFNPLSLTGVERAMGTELPLTGDLVGELRADGPLTDLALDASLQTAGGPVRLAARLDVTDPARGYSLDGASERLELAPLLPMAPAGSRVAGSFRVEGTGFELATLAATGDLVVDESRWGEVGIQGGRLEARASGGRLQLETLELGTDVGRVEGQGDLALAAGAPEGTVEVQWSLDDLGTLRPLLLGESPVNPDTLSALERSLLAMQGPGDEPEPEVPLGGAARGNLILEGGVEDLRVTLDASGSDLAWQEVAAASAQISASAHLVAREVVGLAAQAGVDSLAWGRFAFEAVDFEADGTLDQAAVQLDLRRAEGENYRTAGVVSRNETRVAYAMEALTLDLEDVTWALAQPAGLAWDDGRIEVDRLELTRPATQGGQPVLMAVSGTLELEGPLDLEARASGVDLARVGRIAQMEEPPEGMLELDLRVTGRAEAPVVEGRLEIVDLVAFDTPLSRVAGTVDYADESASLLMEVDQNGNRLLTLSGSYPVNLALGEVAERFPIRPVDLVMEVDELPAATVLGPLEALERVEGIFDGRVVLQGTPGDLEPSGTLALRGGAFDLPEIGILPRQIEATFTLTPDGMVQVEARGWSIGSVAITGSVDLSTVADPGFDLEMRAQGFEAVNRRDLEGRVSGTAFLQGSFTSPRVTGTIQVDQANLYLDEFARTAEVVDLTDPLFFERDFLDDAAMDAFRPVLEASRNPFLDNLRVDADLSIPRDVWLRSREMNVEIGGDLIVTFDRRSREVLLVGQVQALRGNYNAFGRQFVVQGGTVDFVGTPGINPNLNIEAVHRLRAQGGDPLDIVASLEGTLLGMRISLASDAAVGISESDLISYLVFGRPSYALGAAESRMLGDAAISAGIGAAAGQLSSLLGQQVGLDFFNITQAQDAGSGFAALSSEGLVDTQVELGQYITDNLFLALVLRPLRGIGGSQAQIPGARLEWRFTDLWTFNAYVEDRFGREGVYTFGEGGLQVSRIFGLELFRDWGY